MSRRSWLWKTLRNVGSTSLEPRRVQLAVGPPSQLNAFKSQMKNYPHFRLLSSARNLIGRRLRPRRLVPAFPEALIVAGPYRAHRQWHTVRYVAPRSAEVLLSLALRRRAAYPTQSPLYDDQIGQMNGTLKGHGPTLSLRQSEPVFAHNLSNFGRPLITCPKQLQALGDLTAFQFILAPRTRQICTHGPRLVDKD